MLLGSLPAEEGLEGDRVVAIELRLDFHGLGRVAWTWPVAKRPTRELATGDPS